MTSSATSVVTAALVGAGAAAGAWVVLLPWDLPEGALNGEFGNTRVLAVAALLAVVSTAFGVWVRRASSAAVAAAVGSLVWSAIMVWRLSAIGEGVPNLLPVTLALFNVPVGVGSMVIAEFVAHRVVERRA